jgi:hypothetical protein
MILKLIAFFLHGFRKQNGNQIISGTYAMKLWQELLKLKS